MTWDLLNAYTRFWAAKHCLLYVHPDGPESSVACALAEVALGLAALDDQPLTEEVLVTVDRLRLLAGHDASTTWDDQLRQAHVLVRAGPEGLRTAVDNMCLLLTELRRREGEG